MNRIRPRGRRLARRLGRLDLRGIALGLGVRHGAVVALCRFLRRLGGGLSPRWLLASLLALILLALVDRCLRGLVRPHDIGRLARTRQARLLLRLFSGLFGRRTRLLLALFAFLAL